MTQYKAVGYIITLVVFFISTNSVNGQCPDTLNVIFVDEDATTGLNTGFCWTDAFLDFQDALAIADSGDQIWVAEGYYAPDDVLLDWYKSFNLVDGVSMYGGFNGTEDSLHQRDWTLHHSTLTGDIYGNGSLLVYTVVKANATGSSTILDGFVIENGSSRDTSLASGIHADSSYAQFRNLTIQSVSTQISTSYPLHEYAAGAVLNYKGAPTYTRCTFLSNGASTRNARYACGGVINAYGNAKFIECDFIGNAGSAAMSGSIVGGGVLNVGGSPDFQQCTFSLNNCNIGHYYTSSGGAIVNVGTSALFDSCQIVENTTSSNNNYMNTSGGVFNYEGSPTFTNCEINQNSGTAVNGRALTGGGIFNYESSPNFIQCEINNNSASTEFASGGVMSIGADPVFINCQILNNNVSHSVANSASTAVGGVFSAGGNPKFYHCDVSGNYAFTHCLFESSVAGGFLNDMAHLTLTNCNVSGNTAYCTTNSYVDGAGGVLNRGDTSILFNCTIANNDSRVYTTNPRQGGGLLNAAGHIKGSNCLIYGNRTTTAGTGDHDLFQPGGSSEFNYSLFETYTGGINSITGVNPDFIDADTIGSSGPGDFRLKVSSIAINSGSYGLTPMDVGDVDNDGDVNESLPIDLSGIQRRISCAIDIGAYEYAGEQFCPDTKLLTGDSLISCSGNYYVQLENSDLNIAYYLFDVDDRKRVDGPVIGNGGPIDFSPGFVSEGTFEVHGVEVNDKAIFFDGISDYVAVSHDSLLDLAGSFSISFWMKMLDTTQASGYVLAKGSEYGVKFNSSINQLEFLSDDYTGDDPGVGSQIGITDSCWRHYAYVYDGDSLRGYRDQIQQFALAKSFILNPGSNPLFIGATDSTTNHLEVILDDLRIHMKAVDPTQLINESATCILPDLDSLVASYNFNDSNIVYDISANQLQGLYGNSNMSFTRAVGSCVSNQIHFTYEADSSSTILYVDVDASEGWKNGFCWNDAFLDLQDALAVADSGDQIWVAEGVYYPTVGSDRTISFEIPNGVAVYGGFSGNEMNLVERNWIDYPAILDGEIQPDVHSYTVVRTNNSGEQTCLDGFTIRSGNNSFYRNAGGISTESSSARFANCLITNNETDAYNADGAATAGGIFNYRGSPTYVNCIISNNTVNTLSFLFAAAGGAVMNEESHAQFINCTMTGNYSAPFAYGSFYGSGGVFNLNDSSSLLNCIVWDNDAFGANVTIDYSALNGNNLVEYCLFDVYTGGTNCLVGHDPQFISTTDFHLSTSSPVVGQGNNAVVPVDLFDIDGDGNSTEQLPLDVDGSSRIQACYIDMGAFELSQEHRNIPGIPNSGVYYADSTIISSGMIISPNNVIFQSGQSISLVDSFEVHSGAEFEAIIGPCP